MKNKLGTPLSIKSKNCDKKRNRGKSLRVFAFDLDGTILEAGGIIQDETRKALSQAAQINIKLVIATGRDLEDIDKLLKKNTFGAKNNFPHATLADGHKIYFLRNGKYIPLGRWNEYLRKKFFCFLPLCRKIIAQLKIELESRGLQGERLLTPEEEVKREMVGLRFGSVQEGEEARKYISSKLPSFTSELICSRNGGGVYLKYSQATKGRALLELIRNWGIDPVQVLAVGNAQNDEDMLDGRYGFCSATVKNAEENIKRVVLNNNGYIAKLPLGSGIAEILTREITKNE